MVKSIWVRLIAILLTIITIVYSCDLAVFAESGILDETIALEETAEARIGDVYYTTLDEAFEMGNNNEEIIVLKNITLNKDITPSKSFSLNLNGNKIIGGGNNRLLNIYYGNVLTIKNGTLEGGNAGQESGGAVYVNDKAELYLEDVVIKNNIAQTGAGVCVDSGAHVYVKGQVIVQENTDQTGQLSNLYLYESGILTNNGLSSGSSIGISCKNVNVAFVKSSDQGEKEFFTSDDTRYEVEFGNDSLFLKLCTQLGVCKIGNAYFPTINQAIIRSSNGDTIELVQDVAVNNELVVPLSRQNLTFDLCGHTISLDGKTSYCRLMEVNSGQCITIKDSSSETGRIRGFSSEKGGVFLVNGGGNLTLDYVILENNHADIGGAVYLCKDAALTLKGKISIINNKLSDGKDSNVFMQKGAMIHTNMNQNPLITGSKIGITLEQVSIPSHGQKVIIGCDEGKTDISSYFIYQPVDTYSTSCGFFTKMTTGELVMSPYSSIIYHANGAAMPDSYPEKYLEGMTVILPVLKKQDLDFLGWVTDEEIAETGIFEITDSDYGDKNYYAKWSEEGAELIHDGQAFVYKSFQSALQSAVEGDEIRLLKDTQLEGIITVDKNLTVDLFGKTLKGNGSERLFNVEGTLSEKTVTLTIKDSSDEKNGLIIGGRTVVISGYGKGGNFFIGRNGILKLLGGTISDGMAQLGGGIYIDAGGKMEFYGGAVNNNTALTGGGIFVAADGTLDTSSDANIQVQMTGNKALTEILSDTVEAQALESVDRVLLEDSPAVIEGAGSVNGITPGNGSALYLQEGSHSYLGNVSITGNVAAGQGAVFADHPAEGNFTVDEGARITGNTNTAGNASNLFLDGGKIMAVGKMGLFGLIGLDGSEIMGVAVGGFIVASSAAALYAFLKQVTMDDPNKTIPTPIDPQKEPEVKYYVAHNTTQDKKYISLQTAFNESNSGDTIILLRSLTEATDFNRDSVIFSPAGFSLNGAISNNGQLTISGSGSIEGVITNKKAGSDLIISGSENLKVLGEILVEDGKCSILSGTVTSVEVQKGSFSMSGGFLTSLSLVDKENSEAQTINAWITGGKVESADTCIKVKAKNANLSIQGENTVINGTGASSAAVLLENAATVSIKDASITSVATAVSVKNAPLTILDGSTKISSTAAEAIKLSTGNQTRESLSADKLTIEGGVISSTGPQKAAISADSALIEITGGSISSTSGAGIKIVTGVVTVNTATITATLAEGIAAGGKENKGTLGDCTITLTNSVVSGKSGVSVSFGTLHVLEGCAIEGIQSAAISLGGVYKDGSASSAVGTITASTITGVNGGISMSNDSELVLAGAVVKTTLNGSGISAKGGVISIKGATVISSENGDAISAGVDYESSCSVKIEGTASLTGKTNGVKVAAGSLTIDGNVSITSIEGNAVSVSKGGPVVISGRPRLKGGQKTDTDGSIKYGAAVSAPKGASNTISGGYFDGKVTGAFTISGGYYTEKLKFGEEGDNKLAKGYRLFNTSGSEYVCTVKEGKYAVTIRRTSQSADVGTFTVQNAAGEFTSEFDYGEEAILTAPSVPGFTFDGWWLDQEGEKYFSQNFSVKITVLEDTALYAQYTEKEGAVATLTINASETHPVLVSYCKPESEKIVCEAVKDTHIIKSAMNRNVSVEPENETDLNVNWYDGNGHLLNTGKKYTFLMSYDRTISMRTLDDEQGKVSILYTANAGNNILQTLSMHQFAFDSTTSKRFVAEEIVNKQPSVPTYECYLFGGWEITYIKMTGDRAGQEEVSRFVNAESITVDNVENAMVDYEIGQKITLSAVYVINSSTYKLSFAYVDIDGNTICDTSHSKIEWNVGQSVALSINEDVSSITDQDGISYQFDHWEFNGNPISYGDRAVVRPMPSVKDECYTVKLVYTKGQPQGEKAVVETSAIGQRPAGGIPKISIVMSYALPEGSTLESAGYLVVKGSRTELLIGDEDVSQATSTKLTDLTGVYTLTLRVPGEESVDYTFRPYVIYRDASGNTHTIYGHATVTNYNAI